MSCGPLVQAARFNERPNSVLPGSLLGPFAGRVIDADSDQPIADAIVWCAWAFTRGVGSPAPEAVQTSTTRTDADGRYQIPRLGHLPQGLSTRLSSFSMVIYRRGYVAYRQDQTFGQKRLRTAFSQLDNRVELSKWSPELSHAKHLLFIGSGAPLIEASRWELSAAVAEQEGLASRVAVARAACGPPISPPPPGNLDASHLLTSDEVRAITGYTGEFQATRLSGFPSSRDFDSFHLCAVDQPERYDVAFRLWRLDEQQLVPKYEELLQQLPGSKQTDEVADRSFVVAQGEILGVGFLDRSASVVVLLTCGKGQCTKPGQLQALAQQVQRNLPRLAPPKESSPPAEESSPPAEESSPPAEENSAPTEPLEGE